MDDRTLPRVPVVLSTTEAVGVKVTPRCSACGAEVPDITDPKHHVCVADDMGPVETPDGKFRVSTLDAATAKWEESETTFRAEEAAAAAKADAEPAP